jgi:transforming growth factor-beta-induced protein
MLSSAALAKKPEDRFTIVDKALEVNGESGEFSILIAALVGTGLVAPLDGNGQFTVFAPIDAAFEAAGFPNAQAMTDFIDSSEANRATVSSILLYHVARGYRDSIDVLDSDQIRTMSRSFVYPDLSNPMAPAIQDNLGRNAPLLLDLIDIETDNGVIHVITEVLLPFEL